MKNKIKIIVVILLVSVLFTSSIFLYIECKQQKEQEEVFEEITEIVEQKDDDENNTEKRNLGELYEINNDFIGWLDIEDTKLSYPVMQTKENPNYYLKRDFYKNYSSYGTPYIAEQCDIKTSDNVIIYGHHIKNNAMFGILENYKNKDYYRKHSIITFETLEEKSEYQTFAVFKTVAYSSKGFKYYDYTSFDNIEDYNSFVNKCKELSMYDTETIPTEKNQILTLSTCEYSNKNGRLVVMAYKINS